jgi:hypothetical protein
MPKDSRSEFEANGQGHLARSLSLAFRWDARRTGLYYPNAADALHGPSLVGSCACCITTLRRRSVILGHA